LIMSGLRDRMENSQLSRADTSLTMRFTSRKNETKLDRYRANSRRFLSLT